MIAIINHELHPDCSNLFISETMYVDLHHTVLHTVLSVCVQYFYDYKSTDTQYQYYYRYISNCYIYTLKCVFFYSSRHVHLTVYLFLFCSTVCQCVLPVWPDLRWHPATLMALTTWWLYNSHSSMLSSQDQFSNCWRTPASSHFILTLLMLFCVVKCMVQWTYYNVLLEL